MYKNIFILLSLVAGLAGCSPSEEELSNKSRELMDQGKFTEAVGYLDRWLEKNPERSDAYNMRGVAYLELGQTEDALSDFNQAILHDSTSYKPLFNRANTYLQEGQLPEALQDYNQVVRMNPELSDTYLNRSAVLYEMKQFEEAQKDLEQAKALQPNNMVIYYNLAKINLVQDEPARAKENLGKVLEKEGQNSGAFYLLGLAELAEENKEDACRYFSRASRLGNEEASKAQKQYCQ